MTGSGTSTSATTTANATFSAEPPHETNTGVFKVKGTCNPNLQVIGVLMRMSSSDPIRVETTSSKKGAFTLNVKLPEEGTWLMTLTFKDGTKTVGETVFHTTNYSAAVLPVNFNQDLPDIFPADTYTISGTTIKNVKIQCIVEGANFNKQVTTNNSGKFSFKFSTAIEGDYRVILSFQKKGYAMRRFTFDAKRQMSETEKKAAIKKAAVKPAYTTLTKKLNNYVGRYMVYTLYLTDIIQNEDETILFMAMQSVKSGYKDIVVVTTEEDTGNLIIGQQYKLYGQLEGSYEILSAEGKTIYYPSFRLLFFE